MNTLYVCFVQTGLHSTVAGAGQRGRAGHRAVLRQAELRQALHAAGGYADHEAVG